MRTRVKICGITRIEDGLAASAAGVDAIGLVFYPASSRVIDTETACAIVRRLPPFVTVVGLFLDPTEADVRHVLDRVPLDLLQFHGNETAEFCERFPVRYIKAVAMGGGIDPVAYAAGFTAAAGFLLDSHAPGELGGSGKAFDWGSIPAAMNRPLVLAGGLNPENVAAAVTRFRPFAVDVSSGVESAPGIKDAGRMTAFMNEIRGVQDV
ncbi:MAG: phosphoribosylanthranilate isomerase [Aquisalimonadaceae bacterium]